MPGVLLGLCLCLAVATSVATASDKSIAFTYDDLPWASLGNGPARADLADQHQRLMAALAEADVPVTGFVNESKLEIDGELQPARLQMLRNWQAQGAELGNHTWGHVDLHAVGLAAYQADILKGERQLRPLLAESGGKPRWFRHPYLRAGRSAEDKAALARFLDGHGYRIAPVTIDNSDWIWARAYRNALDAGGDQATLARLRDDYVPYLMAKVDYYEAQCLALLGELPPQVLLLHANELNAASHVGIVAALRQRGYAVVTLDQALAHPAYLRPDGYTGSYGPSWVHRWAMAEGRPREFYAGEPATPRWVLDLAGIANE